MIADSNNRIQIILFLDLCRQLLTKWLPLPSLDVLASAATIGFEFSFSSFLVLSFALCLTNFFFGTYNNGIIWNNNILFSFEEHIDRDKLDNLFLYSHLWWLLLEGDLEHILVCIGKMTRYSFSHRFWKLFEIIFVELRNDQMSDLHALRCHYLLSDPANLQY